MKELKLNAYTDETGNTGTNLFDPMQKYLWTGTLLSVEDIDIVGEKSLKKWLKKLNVEELHGNKLGVGRIDEIAESMSSFLRRHDCHLIFTRVEKEHMARTRFIDTILDSGLNRGISSLHYGIRPLRLILAAHIVQNFSFEETVKLWKCYQCQNADLFCEVLVNLRGEIIREVKDPRVKELIVDAIKIGLINPKLLIESTIPADDAPNLVGFTLIFQSLRRTFREGAFKVTKFQHDEQTQFAKSIHLFYEIHAKNKIDAMFLGAVKKDEIAENPLVMKSSKDSAGLQIIDVLLWLMKKHIDDNHDLSPNCLNLLTSHMLKMDVQEFTKAQLFFDVSQLAMFQGDNTPVVLDERAKLLMTQMEQQRQSRMKGMGDFL